MNQSGSRNKKKKSRNPLNSVRFKLMAIVIAIMAVPLIIAIIVSYVSSHREAVKNMEQMNMLRKCGCTEGQGFYLSKPISIKEFEDVINKT